MSKENLDVVWGVTAIAEVIGRSERSTYHLLSEGQIPARKVGNHWCASRKKLERFFEEDAA